MGLISVLYGSDFHAMQKHIQQQVERLVPEAMRVWNVHWLNAQIPAERFQAWELARTPAWGSDSVRVVVLDHAEAMEKVKGSGRGKSEEELLEPSSYGNKLETERSNALVAAAVGERSNTTHLFVLLRDSQPGRGVNSPLVEAARDDGRLLEFSKSAFYEKEARAAHVQRLAQGLGMLLDDDLAELLAMQLGEEDDGHQIEGELVKLQLWLSATGEELTPAVVGELCSHGPVNPRAWARELVARPKSRRRFLQETGRLMEQGPDVMAVLGTVISEAHQALLFKVLDDAGADQGTIASVLRWSNPRRYFPFRRELARADAGQLRALLECAMELRGRVLRGEAGAPVRALELLVLAG